MKRIFLFLFCCFAANLLFAQETIFHPTVKIEFEKTVALKALYKELAGDWYERIKDQIPDNEISYFNFIGDANTNRSIYKKGRDADQGTRRFQMLKQENIVYNDYNTGTTITQKPVYEETFLVNDSLLPIKWHLTHDTREIAGYECRKAVGIIFDTVAVFAFYTDEILVTGGPESIHGLPGMILGVGVPRLHTTWFATKVEVNNVPTAEIKPATKGKKTNYDDMMKQIMDVLRGQWGDKMSLAFAL